MFKEEFQRKEDYHGGHDNALRGQWRECSGGRQKEWEKETNRSWFRHGISERLLIPKFSGTVPFIIYF